MISYTNNGGTGTVTIQYKNDHNKLTKGLEYAAKHIWGGDEKEIPNPDPDGDPPYIMARFDDLTNAEKMDILDGWIRDQLLVKARKQIADENHKQADIDARNDDTIIV